MKRIIILFLIVGCAPFTLLKPKTRATFCIGMTEEEFIRNNPNITENNLDWQLWEKVVNNSPETLKYIETLKKINTYIAYKADEDGEKTHGWAIPHLPQKYIFYPAMYLPHKNHKYVIDVIYTSNVHQSEVHCTYYLYDVVRKDTLDVVYENNIKPTIRTNFFKST